MVTSKGTNYVVVDGKKIKIVDQTATSCSCTLNSSNMPPCRHIFAVRIKYDMCLIQIEYHNKDLYIYSLPVLPLPCNATSTAGNRKRETSTSTSATYSCDSRSIPN